jgi:hypothetical protein
MLPPLSEAERAAWPWRITIDDDGYFVIVDEIDFQWALQWRWHANPDRHKRKHYARRVTREKGSRKSFPVFMHKEVLKRSGKLPPTPLHTMGDHGNGAEWDNRRDNLDWATAAMNRATARTPKTYERRVS